jgi:hypothetical protein
MSKKKNEIALWHNNFPIFVSKEFAELYGLTAGQIITSESQRQGIVLEYNRFKMERMNLIEQRVNNSVESQN